MSTSPFKDIRAVLFDLDGTLIDSAPDLGAAANQLRTERGLPALPLSSYRRHAGTGARGMLSVALELTPEHPDFPAVRQQFFSYYERCIHERTRPFTGVEALLAKLHHHALPWAVVTNKTTRFTTLIRARMAWLAGAGAFISGDTTAWAKPHPAPLLEAAKRLGTAPEHCIYVGDDERDMLAGRAAGMSVVAALYGYLGVHSLPEDWDADARIAAPLELIALLGLNSKNACIKKSFLR